MAGTKVTLECLECGCQRVISEKEIPKGECGNCRDSFGWILNPIYITHGDHIIINSSLPRDHKGRIHKVMRNGKEFYSYADKKTWVKAGVVKDFDTW